jgi:hypothetical protein
VRRRAKERIGAGKGRWARAERVASRKCRGSGVREDCGDRLDSGGGLLPVSAGGRATAFALAEYGGHGAGVGCDAILQNSPVGDVEVVLSTVAKLRVSRRVGEEVREKLMGKCGAENGKRKLEIRKSGAEVLRSSGRDLELVATIRAPRGPSRTGRAEEKDGPLRSG